MFFQREWVERESKRGKEKKRERETYFNSTSYSSQKP
jgi:hypothetical protein